VSARGRGSREQRLYRWFVGGANLAVTLMLAYGVLRYVDLIVPRYGHRFSYVAILMAAVACWTAVRGIMVLVGRTGGDG
jgi:hypothetical protein